MMVSGMRKSMAPAGVGKDAVRRARAQTYGPGPVHMGPVFAHGEHARRASLIIQKQLIAHGAVVNLHPPAFWPALSVSVSDQCRCISGRRESGPVPRVRRKCFSQSLQALSPGSLPSRRPLRIADPQTQAPDSAGFGSRQKAAGRVRTGQRGEPRRTPSNSIKKTRPSHERGTGNSREKPTSSRQESDTEP